ncbi:MAG: LVIVD repeat-containing protein, partial [Vicinamibacterales bacterium]
MKLDRIVCGLLAAGVVSVGVGLGAQQAPPDPKDPRIGLKGGLRDAATAAKNMELLSNLPKPEGFFDPAAPAGAPIAPERAPGEKPPPPPAPGTPPPPPPPGSGFTNSDLAFFGTHVVVGNYHGFNTYDIENARKPRLITSVVCPGGQGDVSVWGNLLFMSVEQTRGRLDCGLQGVQETVSAERFRGVRIFDISDMRKPRQVAAVQTCRGSHTHTLVPDPKDPSRIFVYGSGTSSVRPGEELEGCSGKDAKEDPNTSLFSIDVIEVPLAAPQNAKIVNRPRIFMDETGNIAGLWQGGNHGEGTQTSRMTNQCHDITVFPSIGLAAGACSGNGLLMDISDPMNPKRLDFVVDKAFSYWHSATFNNDGSKVVFTDEWGGGSRPRCRATDPITWGADAIFDIVDRKLVFKGYYKMPAAQTEQENCVAHNGSLIPVPGRDIMVQSWYQGGISVFDFTDSANPVEIAFFDRGPVDEKQLMSGGYWSSYWYNGFIYGAEIARGIDIFRLLPSEHLTRNELEAASLVRFEEFNSQQQPKVTWPPA